MSPDADGDGVTDTEDAYPTDATRAFNSFYPNQANYASLAFEDLWPATGDYDFNDLVVKFQYQTISNGTNKVVQLKCKYEVTAVGAGFINGFGVQFDNLTPQLVASVTGQVLGAGYIALSPNGTEAGQEKTVIIPWDNVELVINRNGGSMFNTMPGSNQGTSVPVEINIFFSTPVETSLLGTAPYNPFLIGQMNRGHEIHLADHLPTSLMDLTLLGTSSDKSIPLQGRYFRTQSNLPWVISVPAVLDHPAEKIMVTDAYLKFSSWAESSGSQYSDWYINKPGYRNSSNIW
jgi:LruC domain-containing protein